MCIPWYSHEFILSFQTISAYTKYVKGDLDKVLDVAMKGEVDEEVEKLFSNKNWWKKVVPKMKALGFMDMMSESKEAGNNGRGRMKRDTKREMVLV